MHSGLKYDRVEGRGLSRSQWCGVACLLASTLSCGIPAGAAPRPSDLVNIAAAANGGRILSASSVLDRDPLFKADNLIDGKTWNPVTKSGSFGWVSNQYDPINMEFVVIGFADNKLHHIGKIVMDPAASVTPERWAKDVEVQVSTETAEGPYRPIAQLTLINRAQRQEFEVLPAEARFIKLMFRSNWGSDRAVGLGEVELFEAIDGTDPMSQVIGRLENAIDQLKRYRQTQVEGGNGAGPVQPAAAAKELSPATIQLIDDVTSDSMPRLPVSARDIAASANGGKIMGYSSILDNNQLYGPEKLIDGQVFRQADNKGSPGWASQGFKPGQEYVTIGFREDRTRLISKFVFNPASDQPNFRWARIVEVEVTSGDAKDGPWRPVATFNLRLKPINQEFTVRPVEAKYVKFVFLANGPGDFNLPNADPRVGSNRAVSLGEIEVYEATTTGAELDATIGRLEQVLIDLKNLRRLPQATSLEAAPAPLPQLMSSGGSPQLSPSSRRVPGSRISVTRRAAKPAVITD